MEIPSCSILILMFENANRQHRTTVHKQKHIHALKTRRWDKRKMIYKIPNLHMRVLALAMQINY